MSESNNTSKSKIYRILESIASGATKAKNYIKEKGKKTWKYVKKTEVGREAIKLVNCIDKNVIKKLEKTYDNCKNGPVIPEWKGKLEKNDEEIIQSSEGIMKGIGLSVNHSKGGEEITYSNDELLKGDIRLAAKYIKLFMLKLSKSIESVWESQDACNKCRAQLKKENKNKENDEIPKYNSISDWCEKTIKKVEDKKFKMDVADFLNVKLKMNEKLAKPLAKLIDSKFVFGDLDLVNLLLAESKLREEMKKYLGYVDGGNDSCLNDAEMENLKLAADTCGLKSLKKAKDLIKKEKSAKNIFKKWHEQLKLTAEEAEKLKKDIAKLDKKEAPQLSNRPELEKLEESDKKIISKDA